MISRITAIALAVFLALGFFAPLSASAQYEGTTASTITPAEQAALNLVLCSDANLGAQGSTLSTTTGSGTIQTSARLAQCAATAQVDVNPIVFGPAAIPANGAISFAIPAGMCGSHTVTLNVTLITGGSWVESWPLPAGASAGCGAATGGTTGVGQQVAFTGSDVSVPLAIGFSLIGTGGLTLLAARKRRDD